MLPQPLVLRPGFPFSVKTQKQSKLYLIPFSVKTQRQSKLYLILHAQDRQGTSAEPGEQKSSACLCAPTSCAGERGPDTQVLGERAGPEKTAPTRVNAFPPQDTPGTPQLCVVLEGNSSPARDTPTLEYRGPEQMPRQSQPNQQEKLFQTKIQK